MKNHECMEVRLAAMARPDVILLTNVGPTHLATLGSVAGVAEAKFELVDAAVDALEVAERCEELGLSL